MSSTEIADRPDSPGPLVVVDDDIFQRRIATAMLRELGFPDAHEAADGAEALAHIRANDGAPLLTLCDLEMPGMDGVEFLCQLGNEHPGSAVALVSSQDRALIAAVESMAKSSGLRVIGAMQKPVTRDFLRECLDKAIGTAGPREVHAKLREFDGEDLQYALAQHQFVPYFQPKIDLQTRALNGAEALMRWRHPDHGLIPPARFIPLAERTGIIVEMTWAMLESAMALIAEWQSNKLELVVSVNITAGFLEELAITENISAMAARHAIPPNSIILELTESMATTDLVAVVANLVRLRMRGFGLSIDDFGTGYASMQQLSRIPFSEIKIDRSFVAGAAREPHMRAILESSVQLGKRLGLATVAEGVETIEELTLVQDLGCDAAQGYYFARPMDPESFLAWAKDWAADKH